MSETPTPVAGPEMAPAPPPAPQPFTERLSDSLQHAIGVIVGSQRKPPRRLKSLLNVAEGEVCICSKRMRARIVELVTECKIFREKSQGNLWARLPQMEGDVRWRHGSRAG